MSEINKNYLKLKENYLFSEVAHRINEYSKKNPLADIIRMGIGDVTLPLPSAVISAMHSAVDEMGKAETFHGYGPEQGYDFLRLAIAQYYREKNVSLFPDEIFISDGAKSDLGNILDIFGPDNSVLVTDPVYPVYVDTNLMAGRKIIYAKASAENDFLPMPDESYAADIIYLCSPNNPTGAVYDYNQLKEWVDFANKHQSIILFDAAYEAFITEKLPRSIYEIEGSETCAIEFCSFSKTAGFTGTRCGYTVIPKMLKRNNTEIRHLWLRRQTTKFNGVPYIVQMGAAAVFSEDGMKEVKRNLEYYHKNAVMITETLDLLNISYTGGKNSPYIWFECPDKMSSWDFFDFLLKTANIAGTPGEGFGECGKGYFRITAFSSCEKTREAMKRMYSVCRK